MTLDEAIQHCKDEAHVLFQHSAKHRTGTEDSCYECAKEHEQLAEWLTELKQRREAEKHGFWYVERKNHMSYGCTRCSECKVAIATRGTVIPPNSYYCMNCGSKNSGENGLIWGDEQE